MSYATREILKTGMFILACIALSVYLSFQSWGEGTLWGMVVSWMPLFLGMALFSRFANFVNGDVAEMDVGDLLDELPEEYRVFSNLVLSERGNIDFVVWGPSGIWVVEVKSHRGYIRFDGEQLTRGGVRFEKDFIKQAWAQVFALKDSLQNALGKEIYIQPVIVFADRGARMSFGYRKQKGVYVVGAPWLKDLILNQPAYLNPHTAKLIDEELTKYKA